MASPALSIDPTPYDGPPVPEGLEVRYPRMVDYLSQQPGGIQAHPECQARSAILQIFLEAAAPPPEPHDPFVARLLAPPARGFIPEVVMNAAFLALADAAGMSDAQFCAWSRAANRTLFAGLLFRALMGFFSPMVLLQRAPARWDAFHTGTRLTVESAGATAAAGALIYPANLYTPLLLAGLAECFAAGFEHARGRNVRVELLESAPGKASFSARWT